MYNLPPKIVLINATSGISDIFFVDSSYDKELLVKPLESGIYNDSLVFSEKYFPQKSHVLSFLDTEVSGDFLKIYKDSPKYLINPPSEEMAENLLKKLESDDVIYFNLNHEKVCISRFVKSEKTKKISVISFDELYENRMNKLVKSADKVLLINEFFINSLNDLMNSKSFKKKYRQSGYLISTLLINIFSDTKIQKEFDLKSFGKTNKTNPVVIIGGDSSKFFNIELLVLALSQVFKDSLGFTIYSDYSHVIYSSLTKLDSDKNEILKALMDKYIETAYYGIYINLTNGNPLQKIYAKILVKDGMSTKDLFGITGTYMKYDFLEGGSAKFEILQKNEKILKSLDYPSLRKSLMVNFLNSKEFINNKLNLKDFLKYLTWENNIKD